MQVGLWATQIACRLSPDYITLFPRIRARKSYINTHNRRNMSLQQHPQLHHGHEKSRKRSSSWRESNIKNRLYNLGPPSQRRTTTSSTATTTASVASSSPGWYHRQAEQPTAFQHQDLAATRKTSVTGTTSEDSVDGCGGGPLKFPMATFSPALRVIEGRSFTLVSKKTGRRWRAINSTRECQFGQVVRAVELMDEATVPPAYFAIKVRVHQFEAWCLSKYMRRNIWRASGLCWSV